MFRRFAAYNPAMHFRDILERDATTISFEFFPPGTEAGWSTLFDRLQDFESLQPSYVSVTYGAGGSSRDRTHDLVVRLQEETSLDPVAHLTCVRHTPDEILEILGRYATAGISNILALRGDAPGDEPDFDPNTGALPHAVDLVRVIRDFNASGVHPDPRGFGIGVAGFPEGHPETPNQLRQMDNLKAKVEAGAELVTTQMFFDNGAYYDWCERCELAGITVPLIAGIMPITSIRTMHRMADLAAGINFPARLQRRIHRCQDDPAAVRRVGIQWAAEQCGDLIDHGVRGIHLYTLNQSDATLRIHDALGVRDATVLRSDSTTAC